MFGPKTTAMMWREDHGDDVGGRPRTGRRLSVAEASSGEEEAAGRWRSWVDDQEEETGALLVNVKLQGKHFSIKVVNHTMICF